MTNPINEINECDFILVMGSNTTETHPIISIEMKKAVRKGATLVVVDPRKIDLCNVAAETIQMKSGTNVLVLNALAYTILDEQLWNRSFVEERTENFGAFKESLRGYAPELVAGEIGVEAEVLRRVARGYANAKNAGIFYTMGVTQHTQGVDTVLAIANLAMLCGHIGKPNSGVNPLRGQNNVQGACDMGALPNVTTAYQAVALPEVQEKFSKAWGVAFPKNPGLTVGEMMDGALEGKIKGMYILGENPMLSDPDIHHVEKALKNLDFLVVQDLFLTETARLADVVLPGASFAEKDGTFSNTERRVQRVRKAIEPVGECRPDWWIIKEVAKAMGYAVEYENAEQIFNEITALTPSYAGITYERIEEKGLQWPCPSIDHPGTPYLHKDKFVRGLGKFHPVSYLGPAEKACEDYPFLLNTGRRLTHYHTGSMTRRSGGLEEMFPEDYLEINPIDAEKLGICQGEKVKVASRRGHIEIRAHITDRVLPGSVFSTFHFGETCVNFLTNTKRDPVSKTPELKVCAVKVEKIG